MGAQASSFDTSSEDAESDDSSCNSSRISRRSSRSSEDNKDDEDINNLTNFQRQIINQSSENRVACISTVKSRISAPYVSLPLCKPQNQPLPLSHQQKQQSLLHESSLLNTRMIDSSSDDVEAEKNKKLLEWELSALEADDLRSHAWYHGQQVDRIEAEQLLREYVAEEHGFGITVEQQHTDEEASDSDGVIDITSDNSDSDGTIDIASDNSDANFAFDDLIDEHGVVVDPLKATPTRLAAALKLRQCRRLQGVLPTKKNKRPQRHFYCFLVRDSLNVRPPGRYVVSCLRVDKYEDLETEHKYKTDKQLRKFHQQQQRRQRRQNRHPVLHFVVNEIILQPGTVYEQSQFTFGETLPSLTSSISAAVVNSNSIYQPGFDSVPDLIRYYVGGADDNAVLSYGGGNDGVVSGTMLSRTQQSEVRIRYPCNRRHPLMTNNLMAEAATLNNLPSVMENSQLNSRCALTVTSNHTEELQILSTSPDGSTEASTSSQNKFYRRRSPSPPSHSSKWMCVQSSKSSVRKTPSSFITPELLESSNPRFDSQSSTTSVSSSLSVSTLPRQPKSSFPLPSTSGLSSSSVSKTNQLQCTSSYLGMPSRNTSNLTSSDLFTTSSSSFTNSPRSLQSTSRINSRACELTDSRNDICRISVSVSNDGVPSLSIIDAPRTSSSVRHTFNERDNNAFSPPFKREVMSSFSQIRIRNGGYRSMIPLWYKRQFNYPYMSSPDRQSYQNELKYCQSQSRRRQASSNSSSIKSSSENDEDVDDDDDSDDDEQEQQQSSSSDSSFVSTSTLKNEEIERKRGKHRHLLDRKIVKKETQEDQDEEDQEVENQMHNDEDQEFESQTDNEEDQENENQTDNEEDQEFENQTDNEEDQEVENQTDNEEDQEVENQTDNEEDQEGENQTDNEEDQEGENQTDNEEDQEAENQTDNEEDQEVENQTDNEEDQEVENQTDNEEDQEVENQTDNEKEDTEEDKVSSDEQTTSHSDFIVENSLSESSENENFQRCRTRWTNTMRKGLVEFLEHSELDHQNGQPTRITGTLNSDPRQRGLRQSQQAQYEDHDVEYMGIRTESRLLTSTDRAATLSQVSPPQSRVTHSFIRSSNNNLTENMIRQWLGLQRISNQSSNSDVTVLYNEGQIPWITILLRTRKQQRQDNSYRNVSEDHHLPAEKFLRENVSLSGETQHPVPKNMNYPQVDRMMLGLSIVNQEGSIAPVTRAHELNITNKCSTTISSLEKDACSIGVGSIGRKMACDYVNINPHIDDLNNPANEVDTQHHNINFYEKTYRRKKRQVSKQQSNNNYNSVVGNNVEAVVDYENLISHKTDNTTDFNYENIDQTIDEKRQNITNDFNGGSIAVADALLAVHLAIIGDPDDTGRTTVGTGKLAAALCRADGQTTVLPYRRNLTKNEQAEPLLSTCPLQLLDQPGSAGRRARLDIIERFACLQYLVAMTVIVTPCLLLIGSHINDKENLGDVNFEWSLEDEYEYRRRRFYYRCAGFDSWRVSDNDSTSDDDDESYKLTANSDFDSGYSLPPREEWAVEKRHWLDILTRHRAAVLDKWIRTAADAKQAVGDVYGYRALMSALCSDRIQSLQDAWAALRRLHTVTAVAFESRLRPEFLGRREKNLVTVLGKPGTNDIDNNDVNELLQLPPNATVPDATALAVLYEHLYNDNVSDADSMNTTATSSNDIGSKKEKDPRLSTFFTSPLLLSPSPWLSLNSGISSGLGSSVGSDYGLSALHILCIQYSDWVQQSYSDDDSILPLIKSPILQLDRFRSNFRALLRQYSGSDFCDYGDDNVKFNYVPGYKDVNLQRKENTFFHKEFNYNRNDEFAYERQYEDNIEEYSTSGDNDVCIDDDDDDDDATVICCNDGNSLLTMRNDAVDTMHGDTHVSAKTENQQQTTTKNEKNFPYEKDQEEDLYDRWIEDASIYNRGSAPLNIVFCTELHVRLFWPPTLFLQDINDNKDTIDHKSAIPAYALGTTYVATATAAFDNEDKSTNHVLSPLPLNHIITEQLDQAAKDMRLRYKAMDNFLDRACAYSSFVAKLAY